VRKGILTSVFVATLFLIPRMSFAQTLIINEVSNGPSGNKEYVEFLVVDDAITYDCSATTPPCINIQGWIFDDNSGYHGSVGVAAGCIRFSFDPLWACVPVGTIIVIYNNGDPSASMPANDVSLVDGNCTIIAPVNSPLFESNATTPGAVACSYPALGWTSGGNWSNTLLANVGDCARIVDLSGCEVFSLCWGTANQNNLIYFAGSGQDDVWSFNGSDPYSQVNWSQGCAGDIPACGSNDQTPGTPNNVLNAAYIGQFNNNCSPITSIVSSAIVDLDASCGCDGQASASASGSIPGYTFEWFDSSMNPIGQTSATAAGLCPGTYSVVASSSIGCADTSIIVITANGAVTLNVNSETICNGENALLTALPSIPGGTYLWSPGGFTTQSINVSPNSTTIYSVDYILGGCVASSNATVTVNPTYSFNESITLCTNTVYTFPDGSIQTISAALTQNSILTSINGCDSIIVTNVTVNPGFNTAQNAAVCQGDTYTFPDGTTQTINAAVSQTSTLTSVLGCDSVIVSTISINPSYNLTENLTLCPGVNYTFPDGTVSNNITANESHISNLNSIAGCDSIITTNITISSVINSNSNVSICSGSTYTFADGTVQNNITTNISSTSFLVSVQGCDSLLTENISVDPVYALTENVTICEGVLYTFPDGSVQTIVAAITQNSILTSINGCDSIIVTNVAINPSFNIAQNATVCEGDTYTFPDGTTQAINAAVSQTSTLTSVLGCDSVIVSTISINPSYNLTENLTLCSGANYTFPDGTVSNNIMVNESHVSNLNSIAGCDSLITTLIEINSPMVDAGPDQIVCEGESVSLTASGAVSYVWDNSVQNAIPFTAYSTLTYSVTGTNNFGCQAQDQVTVIVNPLPPISIQVDLNAGCAPMTVEFSNPDTSTESTWYLSNGVILSGNPVSYTFPSGGIFDVSLLVEDLNGCLNSADSIGILTIEEQPVASFSTAPNVVSTLNSTVQLINSSFNADSYMWIFPDGSSSYSTNPYYQIPNEEGGTYQIMLIASNANGCIDSVTQILTVQEELLFYVPNTFTPDSDEYNQDFKPVFTSGFDPYDYQLLIFNRWGNLIFESYNVEIGWDGTYGTNQSYSVEDGTYVWKIEFKTLTSDERIMKVGHVNLIR